MAHHYLTSCESILVYFLYSQQIHLVGVVSATLPAAAALMPAWLMVMVCGLVAATETVAPAAPPATASAMGAAPGPVLAPPTAPAAPMGR